MLSDSYRAQIIVHQRSNQWVPSTTFSGCLPIAANSTICYLNPDPDWLTNSPAVSRIVATPVAERRQQPARGGQVGDYNRVFAESDPQNKSKRTQDIEN